MPVKSATLIAAAVDVGLVDAAAVSELTVRSRRERVDLIDLLCIHGRFPPSALYQALARKKGLSYLIPGTFEPEHAGLKKLPASLLQRHLLAPVKRAGEDFLLVCDPEDHAGIEMARRHLGALPPLAMAEPEAVASLVNQWLRKNQALAAAGDVATETADYVALLEAIFKRAFLARASDIHIEAMREGYRVRYRVDGYLQESSRLLSPSEGAGLMTRIKVLAGLDIAESREPQDGGMSYRMGKEAPLDVRVATVPTRFGERATLRLMGEDREALNLERLGMDEGTLAQFREAIKKPHGIILITGPTGSGKSTTLYGALTELIAPNINVLTVEDPIERVLSGASQVQVGGKMGFADTLRAFLRHDPDVIMVGEIRDRDTADVALKAAVTGHLVFSTLHTNSAAAAITRLADVGVERFMIAATLSAVIAQRLVRRLCLRCRRPCEPDAWERKLLGLDENARLWEPAGCPACVGTGYRGRIGLFETLWIDAELAKLIAARADEASLAARAARFESLWQDGRRKVLGGLTTLAEVLRVVQPEAA